MNETVKQLKELIRNHGDCEFINTDCLNCPIRDHTETCDCYDISKKVASKMLEEILEK